MSVKTVVVGAGGISGAWFPHLISEGVDVAAVVDIDLEAAKSKIEEYKIQGAEPSTDLAVVLRKHEPDFVVDLTIPEAHCAVTCAALEAGAHVVGEKPMASSMEEARKMVETSERTGRMYMVSQSRRWEERHQAIRDAIRAGTFGDITTVNCDFYIGAHFGGFRDAMPSPLILDMAIHHFDLARCLTGADAVGVYAKEFNPKGSWYKGDTAATCIFDMSDGSVFTYRGSWCAEGFHTSWNGDWRIIGNKGTVLFEKDADPRAQVVDGHQGFHVPTKDIDVPIPKMNARSMKHGLCDMLEYIRTGKLPETECHDNIKSLAMVFAAIESSRKGCWTDAKA